MVTTAPGKGSLVDASITVPFKVELIIGVVSVCAETVKDNVRSEQRYFKLNAASVIRNGFGMDKYFHIFKRFYVNDLIVRETGMKISE